MTNTDSPLDDLKDNYSWLDNALEKLLSKKQPDYNEQRDMIVPYEVGKFMDGINTTIEETKAKFPEAKQAIELYCHKQVIEALERVDKEVDNTVVVLTKDLPSLLSLDHDLKIRKAHKDEIHKIIQEELAELRKTL